MTQDISLAFTDRLRADLKTAMQARAREEAGVLRALIGVVDNAQSVPLDPAFKPAHVGTFGDRSNEMPRRPLVQADIDALLQREIDERLSAATEIERVGRADRAEILRVEAAIVARYRQS
ncbi:MAG TPA: hypothetical protein VGE65_03265 [Sphingobium sp.]